MREPKLPKMTRVVTSEQMRDLDRRATEEYGIPSLLLMENAGRAVFEVAKEMLGGDVRGKRVLVVCGPGNNGGDGFVSARHLHNSGALVQIAYYGDRSKAKGDALTNIEIAEKMGLSIYVNDLNQDYDGIGYSFDLVIDALLGTGAKDEIRPPYSRVISDLDDFTVASCAKILSVDVPSGISADTGLLLTPPCQGLDGGRFQLAVTADVTVTLAYPKIGLLTYPGAAYVGNLVVADIGIPSKAEPSGEPEAYVLTGDAVRGAWLRRHTDANKADYGHIAIVAGSVGMTGAATLAAEGAMRIGTGLVTVAVPETLNDIMEVKLTEAMTIPVPEGKARAFGMASLDKILDIIDKRDAAVIGPGFGRDEDTVAFTLALLKKLNKPAIVDADALFAASTDLKVLKKCKAPLVITPHPGEMARLLGTTAAEVQSNRLEVARSFAKEHGVTVVLKGAGTVIADPDGSAYINTTGTPGMATGGTGDVLSGMIGGLLAQKLPALSASANGVYLHGLAGEIAAERLGEAAMLASDLAGSIGEAIERVTSETSERM